MSSLRPNSKPPLMFTSSRHPLNAHEFMTATEASDMVKHAQHTVLHPSDVRGRITVGILLFHAMPNAQGSTGQTMHTRFEFLPC